MPITPSAPRFSSLDISKHSNTTLAHSTPTLASTSSLSQLPQRIPHQPGYPSIIPHAIPDNPCNPTQISCFARVILDKTYERNARVGGLGEVVRMVKAAGMQEGWRRVLMRYDFDLNSLLVVNVDSRGAVSGKSGDVYPLTHAAIEDKCVDGKGYTCIISLHLVNGRSVMFSFPDEESQFVWKACIQTALLLKRTVQ